MGGESKAPEIRCPACGLPLGNNGHPQEWRNCYDSALWQLRYCTIQRGRPCQCPDQHGLPAFAEAGYPVLLRFTRFARDPQNPSISATGTVEEVFVAGDWLPRVPCQCREKHMAAVLFPNGRTRCYDMSERVEVSHD